MPSAEDTSVHQEPSVVPPTRQDEIAAAGSELIGGPSGRWARFGSGPLTPVRVIVLLAIGMFALGMVQKTALLRLGVVPRNQLAVRARVLLGHPAPLSSDAASPTASCRTSTG